MAAPQGEGRPHREPGGCGGTWAPLLGAPRALLPCACPCPCPCPCPVLAAYSVLQPPPLGLLAQPVAAACDLSAVPGAGPCPPCCRPPAPGRARAGAARESTGALRAWLRRHPRNPYPSKGEKVMLALLSRMSLTQVSTWFANARRRLRKESGAGWAPRGAGEGPPPGSPPGSPRGGERESSPGGSPRPGQHRPPQPKIWSLAEMVASPPPVHRGHPGTLERRGPE